MQSQGVSAEVALRLTPAEGSDLFVFLAELLAEDGGTSQAILRSARDKLDDANALARWLREYVNLALHPEEALDLLDCLLARLDNQAGRADEASEALHGVIAKLQSRLRPLGPAT